MEEVRKYDESWETESGLPDDFDFWVTRSEFGYLPEYTDQQGKPLPLLIWYGESEEGFEGPVTFSLGKGWEPSRDGRTVTNVEKKNKRKFVDTSMMGRLINRVKELGALDTIASRGPATDAKVWEGLGFHLKREEFEFKGLLQDKGGKTSRLMPTAFLGVRSPEGEQLRGEAKGKPAESPAPKQAKAPAAQEDAGIDPALKEKLVQLAQKLDRAAFQKAAMNIPEVVEDADLVGQIIDDTEAGFWTKARAGKV